MYPPTGFAAAIARVIDSDSHYGLAYRNSLPASMRVLCVEHPVSAWAGSPEIGLVSPAK